MVGGWGRLLQLAILLSLASCSVLSDSIVAGSPFNMQLTTPDSRVLQVQAWPPGRACQPCDVILFSHGHSLGSRQYDVLLSQWARAGYVVLAPLHTDSDSHPNRSEFQADDYLELRLNDFVALVDAVTGQRPPALTDIRLSGRYLAAGHSFGALLAQMAGGARVTRSGAAVALSLAKRPIGVIAISPPGPVDGYLSAAGWSHLRVPQLVITGTQDVVPLFAPTWNAHLASFAAGPIGNNYSLVFAEMDHYFNGAFGRLQTTEAIVTTAIEQLNGGVLLFANTLAANESVSEDAWSALATAEVQAATR